MSVLYEELDKYKANGLGDLIAEYLLNKEEESE